MRPEQALEAEFAPKGRSGEKGASAPRAQQQGLGGLPGLVARSSAEKGSRTGSSWSVRPKVAMMRRAEWPFFQIGSQRRAYSEVRPWAVDLEVIRNMCRYLELGAPHPQ
jgi:hypothetical protein